MNRQNSSMFENETSGMSEVTGNGFYPQDTSTSLRELFQKFKANGGKPIELSFRELVPWVFGGSRATHYLHSYPAKLLPQIAHYFLSNDELCPRGGVVLDPFCGSGNRHSYLEEMRAAKRVRESSEHAQLGHQRMP